MKKLFITALIFFISGHVFAQHGHNHGRYDETGIMTRTLENYKTLYSIKAEIVPDSLIVRGRVEINYRNLSDDALNEVYFDLGYHTYATGHEPDLTSLTFDDTLTERLRALDHGYCRIDTLLYNVAPLHKNPEMVGDSSLMKVFLPSPIAPGGEGFFIVVFETRLETGQRIPDFPREVLTVDNWHPVMLVYEDGRWHTDKKPVRESRMTDYSVYRVGLRIDSAYSIIGSGHFLNEREHYGFLPKIVEDSVYIDIINRQEIFAPGRVYQPVFEKGYKEYSWRTQGVRGFPFVIVKDFSIDRAETNQTLITVAYTPKKTDFWRSVVVNSARDIIESMSDVLGRYPYRELTVVTGSNRIDIESPDNFIAVPERICNSGLLSVYLTLKIISSWFPKIAPDGIDDYKFNDGLAAYLTANYLYEKQGAKGYRRYENFAKAVFSSVEDINLNEYLRYTLVSLPADLYMLRYCLGDTAFDNTIRQYMKKSRYHLNFKNDFDRIVAATDHGLCAWFYSGDKRSTGVIDYQLENVKFTPGHDSGTVTGEIINLGDINLPLEIGYLMSHNDTLYERVGDDDSKGGRFSFSRKLIRKPLAVILDPRYRFWDINRDNNYIFFRFTRSRISPPATLFPAYKLLNR